MTHAFTPPVIGPETVVEQPLPPRLVTLDDGRTGLLVDDEALRFFRGLANGLAITGVALVAIVAAIAVLRRGFGL